MFSDQTRGEIINLGNPVEFTVLELANEVVKLTNSESKKILSGEFRPDDRMQRCPDIMKAKRILNWEPKVELIEGLRKTIEYYKYL